MQFIDLVSQQQRIRDDVESRIKAVLDHGRYVFGPEIGELEAQLARFSGVDHAVACASGTDALLMALMAYGVGPGDAVLTTPFTFMATAETVSLLGATPVFVDIDPTTYNLDPAELARVVDAFKGDGGAGLPAGIRDAGLDLKGVIGVDLFGQPADYRAISDITSAHGLFLMEDAAQSFGAMYHDSRACSLGDVATTSFFPAKPLGCYGDGGMIFTADGELADKLRSIRNHGAGADRYDNVRIRLNGRMDSIQAAVLLSKFSIFPEEMELRDAAAGRYTALINEARPNLTTPVLAQGCTSVWAQYSLLAADRDGRQAAMDRLSAADVPTAIYYPIPLHLQTAYASLGYRSGDMPVCEDIAGRIFALPMHPYLTGDEQQRVAAALAG